MNVNNSKSILYLSDGCFTSNDTLILSTGFLKSPDSATSRLLILFKDGWASHDVADDFILSITYSSFLNKIFALGRNGLIKYVGEKGVPFSFSNVKGKWKEFWLPKSYDKGNMSKIRAINDRVYACGWGNQIYQLINGCWVDFFNYKCNDERFSFLDISGFSNNDIYAIGLNGVVFHYNGRNWNKIEIGTNCNLHCILCNRNGDVYIGGAKGTLFKGNLNKWDFIGQEDFRENIWSIEYYRKNIYCTYANDGILKISNFSIQTKPNTHKLLKNKNQLWSIGTYDLIKFNGKKWDDVDWPAQG